MAEYPNSTAVHRTMPGSYVRPESQRPRLAEVVSAARIPVVDLECPDRAAVVAAIGGACRTHGFFQVLNHGLDAGRIADVVAMARESFGLRGGEGEALLRRSCSHDDSPLHGLQHAQGDAAQLARLPPASLPSPRPVRARLAVQPAGLQGDHQQVLQGGPGARVEDVRGDLGEPGFGVELHEGDGERLLPAVPLAGAHLRPPCPHRPQRAHHPAHGPGRRRSPGAPRRRVGRRQPPPRRGDQRHQRPAAADSCR